GEESGSGGVRPGAGSRDADPGRPRVSADLGGSGSRAFGEDRSRRGGDLHPRAGRRREILAARGTLAVQGAAAAWLLPVEGGQGRFRRNDRGGPYLVGIGEPAAGAAGGGPRGDGARARRGLSGGGGAPSSGGGDT